MIHNRHLSTGAPIITGGGAGGSLSSNPFGTWQRQQQLNALPLTNKPQYRTTNNSDTMKKYGTVGYRDANE
jgi:hypothetical protein